MCTIMKRKRETDIAGKGLTSQSCASSQEPSSWKTVLSISKGLFQNWGRQLVQVWWPQGGRHSLVTCLRHSSWLGLSSHLPPAANTLHSPELQTQILT